MKVYISSTQNDLAEYRERVARVLRQMDHTVLYMEEYTAEETRPLDRCIEHVAAADVYVGIFAWRYGHVPPIGTVPENLPEGVILGETSITEAEYHAAAKIPRLVFLLADSEPWPPGLMDAHTGDDDAGSRIKGLRATLSAEHMVAYFRSPEHLANEVMTAMRRQELYTQLELQSLQPVDAHRWMMNPESGGPLNLYDSTMMSITEKVQEFDDETYMIVDLGGGRNWWSTRLYFLASLLVDLTDVRLLVFIDRSRRLFGVSSATSVRDALARKLQAIRDYENNLALVENLPDLENEINRRGNAWEAVMNAAGGEAAVKTWVRKQELRRYLGEGLIRRSIDWSNDEQGQNSILEVVDQIISWPQDLVPLVRDGVFYKVVERDALTEEIAKIFVNDRRRARL